MWFYKSVGNITCKAISSFEQQCSICDILNKFQYLLQKTLTSEQTFGPSVVVTIRWCKFIPDLRAVVHAKLQIQDKDFTSYDCSDRNTKIWFNGEKF